MIGCDVTGLLSRFDALLANYSTGASWFRFCCFGVDNVFFSEPQLFLD